MIWKNIVKAHSIAPRRRLVATALVYGLSLSIRFTSATGEQVEIPAQSLQRARPVMSIMMGANLRLSHEDWAANAPQPIVFRTGWPLGPRAAARGCESSMPMSSVQGDLRQ
ncbi:hypothetical protein ACVWVY_003189 [Bradyrhizobium sp. URHC0002]